MARPTLRLRAVVSCDGHGPCDAQGEVSLDLDMNIDLTPRVFGRDVPVKLPEGWTNTPHTVLCPKCSAL